MRLNFMLDTPRFLTIQYLKEAAFPHFGIEEFPRRKIL
ncbi:hypothetical protein CCP3SC5AM1_170005 [Gammaproteobacteria bacterium]